MFYFKVHRHPSETVIAICDEELLGETLRSGKIVFNISEAFYKGNLVDEAFILDNLGQFTILNVVGNRAVELAVSAGAVSEGNILMIGDVKHAQAVRM